MGRTLIELKNICFSYENNRPVLREVDFSIKEKERIGLIGSNGSGKTTLLHLIVGLLKPQKGRITIFDKERTCEQDFSEVRQKVGLLFQNAEDQLFCATVAEDIAFGPLNLGKSHNEAEEIVAKVLKQVGLEGYQDRITYKLSGGEKRLVSIATVLAMEPEVLLLDEPTYGLDEESEKRVLNILSALPLAMTIISHHRNFLEKITDNIVRISQGKIC
ncbi:MAG: ABC transporter ATP-binding protein [Candidatus Omnitrophica bacterium]|nr:ABC transporter ATP-binding protein [Candidatus Omnitrophota bacterium]